MANRDEGNISRAMSLLREAAAVLTQDRQINTSLNTSSTPNTAEQSNIHASNSSTPVTTSSTPVTTRANTSANTPNTAGVLRNFRTLFAPYASTNSPSTSRGVTPPKRVCKRNENKGKARETWTHEVFCLASIDEEAVPTRERKTTLQLAGLGRIKIKFDASANAVEFKSKLEQVFPKLVCAGGFELLRRASSGNGLVLIRQPASGYSVKYLRDVYSIGQALLYIRPLQMNLDTSADETDITELDSEVKVFDFSNLYLENFLKVTHFMAY